MPEFQMIQDGLKGRGFGMLVGDKGEISARGAASGPTTNYYVVGASIVIAQPREGRLQILIQNLDPVNPLNIRLGTGPALATDLLIPAGGIFSFPSGITYEGEIDGVGPLAAVQVVVIEFT